MNDVASPQTIEPEGPKLREHKLRVRGQRKSQRHGASRAAHHSLGRHDNAWESGKGDLQKEV